MNIKVLENSKFSLTTDAGEKLVLSPVEFWGICRFGRELDAKGEVEEYLSQMSSFNGVASEDILNNPELLEKIVDKLIDARLSDENGDQIYGVVCECLGDTEPKSKYSPWSEYRLTKEECDHHVDMMVANIEGEGVANGSGYYGLKAFELYGNKYNLYCEVIKDKDKGHEAYSLYYALEYDGGDNLWEDWAATKNLDVDELKTLIYDIASKDYTVDVQLNFEIEDLGLEPATLKVLKDAGFETLANIINVGREGLKLIPDLDGAMFDDVVSVCLDLGIELPKGYEKFKKAVESIDRDKIVPGSKVVVDIAEKNLGETVWVNPDITDDEEVGFKDLCVCVDVVYDYNPIDAVEVFKELDYWVESRYNAVTLAEAISKEFNIPVKNLLPDDIPFDKVIAVAVERADRGSDKDTVKSDVEFEK